MGNIRNSQYYGKIESGKKTFWDTCLISENLKQFCLKNIMVHELYLKYFCKSIYRNDFKV